MGRYWMSVGKRCLSSTSFYCAQECGAAAAHLKTIIRKGSFVLEEIQDNWLQMTRSSFTENHWVFWTFVEGHLRSQPSSLSFATRCRFNAARTSLHLHEQRSQSRTPHKFSAAVMTLRLLREGVEWMRSLVAWIESIFTHSWARIL
jgi:hypothetical protein